MNLLGKTALVTGAARGIGRGCALELARAGADVVINDRDRTPQGVAVVAEIEALGRRSELVEGDVFERSTCESVVERAKSALGRIDILISNPAYQRRAGIPRLRPRDFHEGHQRDLDRRFPHEPACGAAHGRAGRRRKDRIHLELPRAHPVCAQRGV